MKKILLLFSFLLIVSCKNSTSGDIIIQIEGHSPYTLPMTCDYYTTLNGFRNYPITGPCSLYKVGDTLWISNKR